MQLFIPFTFNFILLMLVRHHQGEKPRSKSNQRRKLKSPIRIKDKIKELEEKLQREAGVRETPKKLKYQEREILLTHKDSAKQDELTPFKKIERQRPEMHSSDKYPNTIFSAARHPQASKKTSEKEESNPKQHKILRRQSQRQIPSKQRQLIRQQQNLQRLKIENERFKEIYSKSQEKMQELQTVLNSIKGRHEMEKCTLKRTIDGLQKKIEDKKINLGHLYAYDEKGDNFLMVQDRIIAETDNENSSSPPQAPSKKNSILPSLKLKATSSYSDLSLQSK